MTTDAAAPRAYDLLSLGEVMLRLSPPGMERLRRTRSLNVQVAGAQLNVAANMARFGKKAGFLSKLPANELGLLAYDTCLSYGVDMRHVQLVPNTRMGVNYLEFTATPRVGVTIFDRQHSAASTMTAADFDWAQLTASTRIAHTDGIVPGLSAGCREAATQFLQTAKAQSRLTSFDVNYREHIWTPAAAQECLRALLPLVDIVITNRSVSERVFGYSGTDAELARRYHDDFGSTLVCLTTREINGVLRGAWSSIACHCGEIISGRRYEFDVVDRYGTGDAYLAGVLYGYLEWLDGRQDAVEFALNFGGAACALAHTIEGDVAHLSVSDVLAIIDGNYNLSVRR
jgi:2-dehydro-3-deoxygluconokinase